MTAPVIDFRVRLPDEMRPEIDVPPEVWQQYQEVLGVQDKLKLGFEDLTREMDASGIDHAVIHAEYEISWGRPSSRASKSTSPRLTESGRRAKYNSSFGRVPCSTTT